MLFQEPLPEFFAYKWLQNLGNEKVFLSMTGISASQPPALPTGRVVDNVDLLVIF